jgi:hypothetical protein
LTNDTIAGAKYEEAKPNNDKTRGLLSNSNRGSSGGGNCNYSSMENDMV